MVLVLNSLNSIGTDGSFGNEDSEKSVLSAASRVMVPAFAPMGIEEDNWPAVVGIVSGVLAKEVVVGTLDNLYTSLAVDGAGKVEVFSLWQQLRAAAATVPANLTDLGDSLLDPLGIGVVSTTDTEKAAEQQGVRQGVFGAMNSRFDGAAGAFSYLLFMQFSSQFAISGNLHPALAVWLPNVVYSLVAFFLYRMAPK